MPPELRPDDITPAPPNCFFRSVGIIRPARSSPPRIMPRHRHPPVTARGGRRFGLPASAPVQARRRSLPRPAPVSASVHRHPRPGERSSCRSGGSQPLLAALTTLSVCLGFALTTQAETRQPLGVADLSASTAPASILAGGGSRLAIDNRKPRHKKAAAVSLLRFIILRCAWMRICFGRCRRCAGHRPSIHRHGRCRSAVNRYRCPSPPPHPITSRYVKLSATRLPLAPLRARRVYITNVDRTCRLLWLPVRDRIHPAGIAAAAAAGSVW